MTTDQRSQFATALDQGTHVLTLGRALSPVHPATVSSRRKAGFWIGTLESGPREGALHIAEADADGSILTNADTGAIQHATAALHAAVLVARPQAQAVVLLKAPRLAAWGLSGRALPVRYFQMFGYTKAREIPVSVPTPHAVAAALNENPDTPALLLSDGRVLIWAGKIERAIRLVLSLEEAAQVTALADHLGGAQDYPDDARDKIYASLQAQARH